MKEVKTKIPKCVTAAVLISILIAMIATANAAYTVGVQTGNWVQYGDINATWTGSGNTGSASQWNQTAWMKAEIQSVSGTTVTMKTTVHLKNGTEKAQTLSGDVATASGNITMMIIPAGLNKGDTVPLLLESSIIPVTLTINDTATRSYAGASRSVNVLNLTQSLSGYFTFKFALYWDKVTGLAMEIYTHMEGFGQTMTVSYKVTDTNLWSTGTGGGNILDVIAGNPVYIGGIAVVIIVIIVAGVYLVRRRKPPAPSTLTQPAEKPQ